MKYKSSYISGTISEVQADCDESQVGALGKKDDDI